VVSLGELETRALKSSQLLFALEKAVGCVRAALPPARDGGPRSPPRAHRHTGGVGALDVAVLTYQYSSRQVSGVEFDRDALG